MILFIVAHTLLLAITLPPGDEERVWTSVRIVIGNGVVKEDPKARVLPLVLGMSAKGGFWNDATVFEKFDPGVYVARTLKNEDFARLQIDLDDPDNTRAGLVLWVIDRVSKNVPDGKRVELTFTYWADAKKG